MKSCNVVTTLLTNRCDCFSIWAGDPRAVSDVDGGDYVEI
ncbi:hypothetical protein SAMN05216330_110118 [Bradyrhizobium sp. Ghvi]|nr:hypothetical protein SAMN05216330_110118 [Bradyrhizobium sp. Ghvi]